MRKTNPADAEPLIVGRSRCAETGRVLALV